MYLSKRLQGQLQGGSREITKAAQSINELGKAFSLFVFALHFCQAAVCDFQIYRKSFRLKVQYVTFVTKIFFYIMFTHLLLWILAYKLGKA